MTKFTVAKVRKPKPTITVTMDFAVNQFFSDKKIIYTAIRDDDIDRTLEI